MMPLLSRLAAAVLLSTALVSGAGAQAQSGSEAQPQTRVIGGPLAKVNVVQMSVAPLSDQAKACGFDSQLILDSFEQPLTEQGIVVQQAAHVWIQLQTTTVRYEGDICISYIEARAVQNTRYFDRKTETDRSGRVAVNPDLTVHGLENVYLIGDTALAEGDNDQPLPALAQVAHQQGGHLGKALRRNLTDGTPIPPFRYRSRGDTAVIGRNAAVFVIRGLHLKGRIGWILWALVHIYLLTGFEKRLLVAMQWLWQYITYQSGARLILSDRTRPEDIGDYPGGSPPPDGTASGSKAGS